jgi:hypothetical protein
MRRVPSLVLACIVAGLLGCADPEREAGSFEPEGIPRRTVIWLGERGLDEITAAGLARVGIDQVVIRRGALDLTGSAPVVRFDPWPELAGDIPIAFLFELEGVREGLDEDTAVAVWRAIAAEEARPGPAEIILDMPELAPGLELFVESLARISGSPVVPLLSLEQLADEGTRSVVSAAGSCVVPVFGTGHPALRGSGKRTNLPLEVKLLPLAELGVRVRLAVSLYPVTEPAIDVWGDDLDPLTEPGLSEVTTSSSLDRSFTPRKRLEWSGRSWMPGDRVAVRWFDVARLHASLAEINRLILPEVAGWDLVSLPPPGPRLGMGEEALLRYLRGDGPAPTAEVRVSRSGRTLSLSLVNTSPFATAVSGVANWVEVIADRGTLVAERRGSFDRIRLGSRRTGEWKAISAGVADALRFHEIYLAPYEKLDGARVRLSSSRNPYRVRWRFQLSSGEVVSGALEN